jgi:Cu(I)/Ag(I) efflux system membrane fusion protein
MKVYNGFNLKKILQSGWILLLGLLLGALIFGGENVDAESKEATAQANLVTYTCSMHPQVQLEKAGACPLCGMDLVAKNVKSSLLTGQFEMQENALALANISTVRIEPKTSPNGTLRLSGVIQTNEKTDAIQTTLFDGRIDQLNISAVGEYIRKGQKFGMIYSPELYLAQDKLLTSSSYKDTHVKLYEASRNGLGLWKLTDAQIDEILRTREPMVNFALTADVSGTVTEVMAKPGNFYKQGDPLFKISNLNTVWAVFDAYENQVGNLAVGQSVTIKTQAFPGEELQAKISFIEPLFDNSRRTVAVRVVLNNREGLLKPGMFAQAEVFIERQAEGVWIPKSAVLWTGKRSLVYLKAPATSTVFESREITIGSSAGDYYEVVTGLNVGDEIVVNGTFTIDAAAQLDSKTSMMNRKQARGGDIYDGSIKPLQLGSLPQEPAQTTINSYLQLKGALVASNPEQAQKFAGQQLQLLQGIGLELSDPNGQRLLSEMAELLEFIVNSKDLEVHRTYFKPLSEKMIVFAGSLKDPEATLYVQHCPMADDNKGADWLSLEEVIANPYYGDKMLRCGKVVEKIQ